MTAPEVPIEVAYALPPLLDDSITGTPARAPGSVRRTSTIDMFWPEETAILHLHGRARDLATLESGDAVVVEEATIDVTVGPDRTVKSISVSPARATIGELVGVQGGSYLRRAIDEVLPGEREAATPLYLLLDDIAGTSLIGGFAIARLEPERREAFRRERQRANPEPRGMRKGRVICSGLRPGGWSQTRDPGYGHAVRRAGDITSPDDPLAWHELPTTGPGALRRHRRIDVAPAGSLLAVDAFFRDAFWDEDGIQMALHEYTVDAEVDARLLTLLAASARPRVLPFPECRWAAPNVEMLVGMPVHEFRSSVQETLTEVNCCTHLNDMLRSLAEVPALADDLRRVAAT